MCRRPGNRRFGPCRNPTQAGGVLVLLISLLTFFSWAGPAGADIQPGTVTCSQVTGRVSFEPPLVEGGTASEAATLALTIKGCVAAGGGTSPTVAHGAGELPMASNTCTNLASRTKAGLDIVISWRPTTDGSTTLSFPGFTPTTGSSLGLHMGGRHTRVTGSYAGSDRGATSTAAMTFGSSPADVTSACASSTGLKRLKIQAGVLTLG